MANLWFRNIATGWGTAANWSTTSDGLTPSGAIPTAADNVFFTALSGDCTTSGAARSCLNLTLTGYTNTITLPSGNGIGISGNVTLDVGNKWVAGGGSLNVSASGNTWTCNGNNVTVPINFQTGANTVTLADAWTCTGLTTATTGAKVMNGGSITVNGSLTLAIALSGTTTIVLGGTGTWSGNFALSNPLTINTAGTITVSGNVTCGGDLTYTAGTVVTTGSTLTLGGTAQTLNTNGITWNNITIPTGANTITLTSNLTCSGTFQTNTATAKIMNGFSFFIGGNLTLGVGISGTTTIVLNGTGTWSGNFAVANNLTINTAGTITISGTVSITSNLTYTAGTVITTGSTLTLTNATTANLNTAGIVFVNVTNTGAGTTTLLSDLTMTGNFANNTSKILNGFTMYVGGGANILTQLSGSTNIILNGTGILTTSQHLYNNLTINTTGTITMGSFLYFDSGILRYISGTVITTGNLLNVYNNVTLDTNGIVWNNITVGPSAVVTNSSLFTATGTITFPLGNASWLVTGFVVGTLTWGSSATAYIYTLASGVIYRVTTRITNTNSRVTIKSSVAGTRARLTLDAGGTTSVGFTSFTDIDASGGITIYVFAGTVSNCININVYSDVFLTTAKSFVS